MCTDRKQFIHDLQKNMRNISFRNFAMRKKMKTKQFDYGISSILEQTHKQIHTKEEPKEWPSFVLSRKKRKRGRSFIIHYSIKFLTIDHHNYLFVSKQKWNDTFVIFMRHIMCDLSFVLV